MEVLEQSKKDLKKYGFTLDRLIINDDLPRTPIETGFIDLNCIPKTINSYQDYMKKMGLFPVVYEGENAGCLFRHVVPRLGLDKQISSHGSKNTFLPHVDNPDLSLRYGDKRRDDIAPCPDTLSLLCLRQPQNTPTSLVCIDDIVANVGHRALKLLQENKFCVRRPASFDSQVITKNLSAVIQTDTQGYISRVDCHNIYSDSTAHQTALEEFKDVAKDQSLWRTFILEPSQILTFDNQRMLHTRKAFTPAFDGQDRWLIRVFGLYDKPPQHLFLKKNHLKTPQS